MTVKERLNALLALEASVVGVWLLVIFFTNLQKEFFLNLQASIAQQAGIITIQEIVLSIAVAVLIFFFLYKKHLFGIFISILLGFLGFTGALLYFGPELSFFLAVSLILFERLRHSFLSNNLLVLFGVLFGSIPIGISYRPELLLLILVFFSVYDVLGVFLTKFIPHMARKAVESKAPLLFIAPRSKIKWTAETSIQNSAAILGAGDAFLPAFVLASVTIFYSVPLALILLIGAVIGGILNTLLAMIIRSGIPAMPLITIGMAIAFILGR